MVNFGWDLPPGCSLSDIPGNEDMPACCEECPEEQYENCDSNCLAECPRVAAENNDTCCLKHRCEYSGREGCPGCMEDDLKEIDEAAKKYYNE